MTELKTGRRRGPRVVVLFLLADAALFSLFGQLADSHGMLFVGGGLFTMALIEWQGRL